MPSFSDMKRLYGNQGTVGQQLKKMSDDAMEMTWDNDIQSRRVYLYDYFHDDKPWQAKNITHENTTKTPVDAKFIVTRYSSLDKDQIDYHLMFKPSQSARFNQGDSLYYYETDYHDKYLAEFPIGLFCDIPDDRGVYNKWLVCLKEIANQFVKYSVLPCDYYAHWIEFNGNERIKRKMWGTIRTQSSYNSGVWRDHSFEVIENQTKLWLPLNSITEHLHYTNIEGDKNNQRIVVGAPVAHPNVWQVTKVENTKPFGLQKLTLAQDMWNPHTDYIDKEEQAAGDMFAMYADYYSSTVVPTEKKPTDDYCVAHFKLSCNSNKIKAGGSYKTIKLQIIDEFNVDVTKEYQDILKTAQWQCFIGDEDITRDTHLLTWKPQDDLTQMKIKFANNRMYLTEVLTIKCFNQGVSGEINLEISAL